jgi:hypothetical protein
MELSTLKTRKEFWTLRNAVDTDNELWKFILPGRPILKTFANKSKIEVGTLKRLYIRCAQSQKADPFLDIRRIFRGFAKFGSTELMGSR